MALSVGSFGLDSSGASLNEQDAYKLGSRFRIRYSSGAGNSQSATAWKLCKPGEIAAIIASGQDFIANSEWYESRVTEGAAAGAADGAADLKFWESRGYAKGATIYPSWDAAPDPAKYQAVVDYIGSYNQALQGQYRADGMYAGAAALAYMYSKAGIKHGWIPEATSWSNLPNWYYQPTNAQLPETTAAVAKLAPGLTSIIWQDGNKWYNNGADENIIVLGAGNLGSHLQASGAAPAPGPASKPQDSTTAALHRNRPWPSYMAAGHYFGDIKGPAQSHGGANTNEVPDVQAVQQKLIVLGFVPGHSNHDDGWADGKFEQPTADAVTRFQQKHMPGTQYYGQVWSDDWAMLFSL
ncbi:MAG TPA: peptidoglycan-binding domain-containing protein [Jatrophihabitans sp.]|nr:peptidoglycan-binding domain-containing protein [Jatrophihabitans sp.]